MNLCQSRVFTATALSLITMTILVMRLNERGMGGSGGRGGRGGEGGERGEEGGREGDDERGGEGGEGGGREGDDEIGRGESRKRQTIIEGAGMGFPSKPVVYRHLPPPESNVVVGRENQTFDLKRHLNNTTTNPLRSYYHLLKSLSGHCRKLYRAGGKLPCRGNSTTITMDGDKLVCLDVAFGIVGGRRSSETEHCLVLSFGVFLDTSFDASVRRANCEVFMFDILAYAKYPITNDKYVHFHQMGLDVTENHVFVNDSQKTFHFSNLNNIALKFGLQKRVINILKLRDAYLINVSFGTPRTFSRTDRLTVESFTTIDIEGDEWNILADLLSQPYLDVIGQIAVELHSFPDNLRDPLTDDLELKTLVNILLGFEKRGFRRVAYWDNTRAHRLITDYTDGMKYHADGETLLINTNWYDHSFRERLRAGGLNLE